MKYKNNHLSLSIVTIIFSNVMLILSSPSNPLTDVTAIGDSIRVLHVETPGPVDKQLLENNTESLYTVTYSVGRRR